MPSVAFLAGTYLSDLLSKKASAAAFELGAVPVFAKYIRNIGPVETIIAEQHEMGEDLKQKTGGNNYGNSLVHPSKLNEQAMHSSCKFCICVRSQIVVAMLFKLGKGRLLNCSVSWIVVAQIGNQHTFVGNDPRGSCQV